MEPCPTTKFNPSFFGSSSAACKDCQKGRYCPDEGMDDLSNSYCSDGFICNEASDIPAPTDDVKGYACEIGYKCPALVIHPLECEDGRKTTEIGQANC